MNLAQFIETYQDAITQAVLRTLRQAQDGLPPPVYTARNRDEWGFDPSTPALAGLRTGLRRLRRRPLGAQGDAIRAVAV